MLAGVSVDYYIRLERGDARGASDEVLDGIARALRLDDAERGHLLDLIRTSDVGPARRQDQVRDAVRQIVDAMRGIPAMVRNRRLDILYANQLGHALYSGVYDNPARPANPARYVFLDRASRRFFHDWDRAADDMVALLRSEAGRNPTDDSLTTLIEELSTGSVEFRNRWTAHDVLLNRSGIARFHHPGVGDLTLAYEDLILPEDPGQTILAFTTEPGAESHDQLTRLAIWAAAQDADSH